MIPIAIESSTPITITVADSDFSQIPNQGGVLIKWQGGAAIFQNDPRYGVTIAREDEPINEQGGTKKLFVGELSPIQ